jgi:hypothetical protein
MEVPAGTQIDGSGTIVLPAGVSTTATLPGGNTIELPGSSTLNNGTELLPPGNGSMAVHLKNGLSLSLRTAAALSGDSVFGYGPSNVNVFTDVNESDWFYQYVMFDYVNSLLNGVSATEFAPSGTTTRGMAATLLYNLAGDKTSGYALNFTDVPADSYYAAPISWAQKNSIISGVGEGLFEPESKLTRQQFAVMLFNLARHLNWASHSAAYGEPDFADKTAIAAWASEAVTFCFQNGIISGRPDGTFDPNAPLTRAEIATMIYNFCKVNE